ncbi:MAG: RNA methyltransferase [Eubacterium sp.]
MKKKNKLSAKELAKLQKRPAIGVLKTTLFKQMSDTVNPQGIMAVVTMPSYDREQMISSDECSFRLETYRIPVIWEQCLGQQKGTGMPGVVLSSGCVDLFNPKVVRSTMGAMFRVQFYICESMSEEMKQLQEQSFLFYAAHLQDKKNFREETYDGRIGILIGNEANGLSDEVTALADKK